LGRISKEEKVWDEGSAAWSGGKVNKIADKTRKS
jgi:hypothetical protein